MAVALSELVSLEHTQSFTTGIINVKNVTQAWFQDYSPKESPKYIKTNIATKQSKLKEKNLRYI